MRLNFLSIGKMVAVVYESFPLIINPTKFDFGLENMFNINSLILKEHKFSRNSFSEEDLLKTKALRNIEQYNLVFQKFYLEDSLNTLTELHEFFNDELIEFGIKNVKIMIILIK